MSQANLWRNPEKYEKLNDIQKEYLEELLKGQDVSGKILDVGCGTGSSLLFINLKEIDRYEGIDISEEMIDFAKLNFQYKNVFFRRLDFLDYNSSQKEVDKFDAIISAFSLHWFRPKEKAALTKITNLLKLDGMLHIVVPTKFKMIGDNVDIVEKITEKNMRKYGLEIPKSSFEKLIFTELEIRDMFEGFKVLQYRHFEKLIYFKSMQDFKDWHLSSGFYLAKLIPDGVKSLFIDNYFEELYSNYIQGNYVPMPACVLLNLARKGDCDCS